MSRSAGTGRERIAATASAQASGVAKAGMPLADSSRSASGAWGRGIATIGAWPSGAARRAATSGSTVRSGRVWAEDPGATTSSPVSGSARSAATTACITSALAPAMVTSISLPEPSGTPRGSSAARACAPQPAIVAPAALIRSSTIPPPPPVVVNTVAVRGRAGGSVACTSAPGVSSSASSIVTSTIPTSLRKADSAPFAPAIAPVWDTASSRPSSDWPIT